MSLLSQRLKRLRGSVRVSALVGLLVGILMPAWLWAGAPAWWAQRGVLVSGATADDYAAVNQGQVKNIAKQGYEEMKATLPGGAGAALDAVWANPVPSTDDYRAINLGQLKTLAQPFYDRLAQLDAAIVYPWCTATTPADDFALVNIGQVKNLFSFDPQSIADLAVKFSYLSDPLFPLSDFNPTVNVADNQLTLAYPETAGATTGVVWLLGSDDGVHWVTFNTQAAVVTLASS